MIKIIAESSSKNDIKKIISEISRDDYQKFKHDIISTDSWEDKIRNAACFMHYWWGGPTDKDAVKQGVLSSGISEDEFETLVDLVIKDDYTYGDLNDINVGRPKRSPKIKQFYDGLRKATNNSSKVSSPSIEGAYFVSNKINVEYHGYDDNICIYVRFNDYSDAEIFIKNSQNITLLKQIENFIKKNYPEGYENIKKYRKIELYFSKKGWSSRSFFGTMNDLIKELENLSENN